MHCDPALHTGWNETRTLCSTRELVLSNLLEAEPANCGTSLSLAEGFLKKQLLKPDRGRRIHIEVPMLRILIYLHPAAQTTRGSTATPEQRGELRAATMS